MKSSGTERAKDTLVAFLSVMKSSEAERVKDCNISIDCLTQKYAVWDLSLSNVAIVIVWRLNFNECIL